jgi:hypothetical protein
MKIEREVTKVSKVSKVSEVSEEYSWAIFICLRVKPRHHAGLA